mmetsp:Transcript_1483/g.3625  ORF Transcript_1483/g.3625 Transcript_1483/m.3625 type:complete len:92 (-) Transcript_1483:819-1094(-)
MDAAAAIIRMINYGNPDANGHQGLRGRSAFEQLKALEMLGSLHRLCIFLIGVIGGGVSVASFKGSHVGTKCFDLFDLTLGVRTSRGLSMGA